MNPGGFLLNRLCLAQNTSQRAPLLSCGIRPNGFCLARNYFSQCTLSLVWMLEFHDSLPRLVLTFPFVVMWDNTCKFFIELYVWLERTSCWVCCLANNTFLNVCSIVAVLTVFHRIVHLPRNDVSKRVHCLPVCWNLIKTFSPVGSLKKKTFINVHFHRIVGCDFNCFSVNYMFGHKGFPSAFVCCLGVRNLMSSIQKMDMLNMLFEKEYFSQCFPSSSWTNSFSSKCLFGQTFSSVRFDLVESWNPTSFRRFVCFLHRTWRCTFVVVCGKKFHRYSSGWTTLRGRALINVLENLATRSGILWSYWESSCMSAAVQATDNQHCRVGRRRTYLIQAGSFCLSVMMRTDYFQWTVLYVSGNGYWKHSSRVEFGKCLPWFPLYFCHGFL